MPSSPCYRTQTWAVFAFSVYLACTYVYAQVLRKGGMMYDEQGQQRSGPAIAQKVQEQLQRHPDYWL